LVRNVWRSAKHKLVRRLAFRDALAAILLTCELRVGRYFHKWSAAAPQQQSRRRRDLLPLPRLAGWPAQVDTQQLSQTVCLEISNICISGLNCLHGGLKEPDVSALGTWTPTKAQASAHRHVCSRVVSFLSDLDSHFGNSLPWRNAFQCNEGATAAFEELRSEAVDLPGVAGTCNTSAVVPEEMQAVISDVERIFPAGLQVKEPEPHLSSQQRQQYVLLTIRELRCGKLRLRTAVQGMGGVFAVGKTSGRQRKVWDGSCVSCRASRPPKPCRLANPASFLDLEIEPGSDVFFSKRDASTFFDALQAPAELQGWFAQPPVHVDELLAAGLSMEDVLRCCDDRPPTVTGDTKLFPVHTVWPMGFSWSSAVAQETTLALCRRAGIEECSVLSLDHALPACFDEACFVATDDTVLVHKRKDKGASTLIRLDQAFEDCGVPRNRKKDVTLESQVTALGCDLTSRPAMARPNKAKLGQAICSTLDLLDTGVATPEGFHSLLGVWEWFSLLQRPFFSIYDAVFGFVRREPSRQKQVVPSNVMDEILLTLVLSPLFCTSLDREPLQFLTAADAAPQYGFGVSVCCCSATEAGNVCRLAERRGDYVRLTPGPEDPPEVGRLGQPHRLRFSQADFVTVMSCKAKGQAHSGVLEAHAYLLSLKWIARKAANHHHKAALLLDAKVVVGAASKGRSSARALRTVLTAAAATTLAADLLPRIVYIPSESNPADGPSRGKRPFGARPLRNGFGKRCSQKQLEVRVGSLVRLAKLSKT
ncbi:unnamed protein product, partial [Symbiodinium necroappetens]